MSCKGFPQWLAGEQYKLAMKELNLNNTKLALFYVQNAKRVYEECKVEKPQGFDQTLSELETSAIVRHFSY